MKKVNFFAVMIVALFATMGTLTAQEKYAIIIGGNMNPGSTIPDTEQWNGGNDPHPTHGFDEFWNDAYLNWEMLVFDKGYTDANVHVLFNDGYDFTFYQQDIRYQAEYHYGYEVVTDFAATESNIQSSFTNLASTITEDDFLFVWIMGHGGTNPFSGGSYFYSYDNQKVYDSELATWLGNIPAHRKVVYLSFPKSGGFVPELEDEGTIVITAGGASQSASRADDLAPNGAFTENEVRSGITYNHGEINYHLFSSLTGNTPFGEAVYSGTNLSTVDVDSDNYININESWNWISTKETIINETPLINDPGEIKISTGLDYPTLLHQIINSGEVGNYRGLIGISSNLLYIYGGGEISFHDNSQIYILNQCLIFSWPGSTFNMGNNVTVENISEYILYPGSEIFIYADNFSIGDGVSFISDSFENILTFIVISPLISLSVNELNAVNCNISFEVDRGTFNNVNITNSIFYSGYRATVQNSTFVNTKISGDDAAVFHVSNCNFNVVPEILSSDQTISYAIYVGNSQSFEISNCTISGYLNNGIHINESGLNTNEEKLISNCDISNIQNDNGDGKGIRIYNSNVDLSGLNNIYNNDFGVVSLNNSEVSIYGIRSANYVHETQQIHDNSVNQVYATNGAFPYELRFNAIYDEDNSCLVGYAPDPVGIAPNLEVIYNYWGTNFNPQEDLCPSTSYYSWLPVWNPPGSKPRTRLR